MGLSSFIVTVLCTVVAVIVFPPSTNVAWKTNRRRLLEYRTYAFYFIWSHSPGSVLPAIYVPRPCKPSGFRTLCLWSWFFRTRFTSVRHPTIRPESREVIYWAEEKTASRNAVRLFKTREPIRYRWVRKGFETNILLFYPGAGVLIYNAMPVMFAMRKSVLI